MASTRRRLFKIAAFGAGGLAVAGAFGWRFARDVGKGVYRRMVDLPLSPRAALEDGPLAALMAATSALLDEGYEEDRYRDFFRWKSENVLGYHDLYRRFGAAADSAAARRGARTFAEAPRADRSAILEKAAGVRAAINSHDNSAALRIALFDREWLLFERFVVREILTLFANTDAWLLSGYGPHPGVPRGLEAYRKPIDESGGGEAVP